MGETSALLTAADPGFDLTGAWTFLSTGGGWVENH